MTSQLWDQETSDFNCTHKVLVNKRMKRVVIAYDLSSDFLIVARRFQCSQNILPSTMFPQSKKSVIYVFRFPCPIDSLASQICVHHFLCGGIGGVKVQA